MDIFFYNKPPPLAFASVKWDFGENGYQRGNRIQSGANPDGFVEKK